MTSSRDSLIPDTKPRSEAEARIAKALKLARDTLDIMETEGDLQTVALITGIALDEIVNVLDGGKS